MDPNKNCNNSWMLADRRWWYSPIFLFLRWLLFLYRQTHQPALEMCPSPGKLVARHLKMFAYSVHFGRTGAWILTTTARLFGYFPHSWSTKTSMRARALVGRLWVHERTSVKCSVTQSCDRFDQGKHWSQKGICHGYEELHRMVTAIPLLMICGSSLISMSYHNDIGWSMINNWWLHSWSMRNQTNCQFSTITYIHSHTKCWSINIWQLMVGPYQWTPWLDGKSPLTLWWATDGPDGGLLIWIIINSLTINSLKGW